MMAAGAAAAPLPPRYRIALPAELAVDQGQGGALSLTLSPDPGYSISRTGPLVVSLAAPEGLELPRTRYQRAQAADPQADSPRFDLAVRGARPGRYQLTVELSFWLCRGKVCRPIRASRTVAIEVRAPAT